ncbi:MAG: response regulator transcription factor [Bacteroidota bacterium]
MRKVHNVFLVDDHSLFRDGIKFILEQVDDIQVCGEASGGSGFLNILKSISPDLVLMDIYMPDMSGIETSIEALRIKPDLKILALSMLDDPRECHDMIKAGASGYVLKESDSEELIQAIRYVASGNTYFQPDILSGIMKAYPGFANTRLMGPSEKIALSQRENLILKMICEGLSNKEISKKVKLSQRTVEGIRSGLLNKTRTSNSLKLALFAYHNNMI